MKLYFYGLDIGGYGREPRKISCIECEVEEKPKTYMPINGSRFPNYICRLRKDDIGHFVGDYSNLVAFTEPSFERAKEMFKNREKARVENAKRELDRLENVLRVIEESEEK